MICKSCGAEVLADSAFCPKCGTPLAEEGAAASSQEAPRPDQARNRLQEMQRKGEDREKELWQGRYSGKAMAGTWFLAAILSIGLIPVAVLLPPPAWIWMGWIGAMVLVWLGLGLVLAYEKLSVRYRLTNQQLVHKRGILKQVTDRIEVIDIDDVTFEQGLIQRMFGLGSIKITSSDRTHPELRLTGIDDVERVAHLMDDARREERLHRGLHIESI